MSKVREAWMAVRRRWAAFAEWWAERWNASSTIETLRYSQERQRSRIEQLKADCDSLYAALETKCDEERKKDLRIEDLQLAISKASMARGTGSMTDAELERLSLLLGGCAEVIRVAAKVQIHGWQYVGISGPLPARMVLEKALGIVLGQIYLMIDSQDLRQNEVHSSRKLWRMSLIAQARYQQRQHEQRAVDKG